ncbi:hypothetical protein PF010_g8955 [Phytophthora fragariae]|uniref:Uncharacterized protein n=1 Tax=Phytophthora fragariae TaxID=53985 RepID=A0A6G0LDR3_9STRA|nr:hypothetical protein PF010_g8955 [Phytophthora fragariae]
MASIEIGVGFSRIFVGSVAPPSSTRENGVILSRAGLSAAQQRNVCFGAVKDEVKQTEAKLADALASLKKLREVVRVAHNAQPSLVGLPTSARTAVARMTQVSKTISPLLEEIRSSLNTFATPRSFDYSTEEEDEEDEEDDELARWRDRTEQRSAFATSSKPLRPFRSFASRERDLAIQEQERQRYGMASMRTGSSNGSSNGIVGQKRRASSPPHPVDNSFLRPTTLLFPRPIERESIWPRYGEYRLLFNRQRPRSPVPQTEKKIAQVLDGLKLRLSNLPVAEQDGVFYTSIKSAIKVVRLDQVADENLRVQQAVNTACLAVKCLLDRNSKSPDSDDHHNRLEDVRQVLSAVVRAILDTKEKLEASGLRDLLDLAKRVEDTFPASAARFKWCSTQLRKFVTSKYKKPAQISVDDQNKLVSIVAETRDWRNLNDYTASRFREVMAFVMDILDGSYEDWEPREDSRLAELVGIMIVRVGAFRESHIQRSRQLEIHGWAYKMSGSSFTPTLDLVSAPPHKPTLVYAKANKGFCSMADVDEGFEQMSKAQAQTNFEFLTLTAYTFLASTTLTQNQVFLPIHQLKRFNESLQGLQELDINRDPNATLKSYQALEKVLYLMRVVMHRRPEYQGCSTSTVDTLLALFPASKRPTFKYPSTANSMSGSSDESDED